MRRTNLNKKAFIPISALIGALLIALVAAMTPFVAERNLVYAQTADGTTVEYAENGEGAVATFTAEDPEGATPITWSLLRAERPRRPLIIPLVTDDADNADGVDDFDISKDGVLTFDIGGDTESPDNSVSPDFENRPGAVRRWLLTQHEHLQGGGGGRRRCDGRGDGLP